MTSTQMNFLREWILYLTRMSVGVFWTVDLFLEIPARLGRWKDSFLFAFFIRISKKKRW
jgi:hypothetical protein